MSHSYLSTSSSSSSKTTSKSPSASRTSNSSYGSGGSSSNTPAPKAAETKTGAQTKQSATQAFAAGTPAQKAYSISPLQHSLTSLMNKNDRLQVDNGAAFAKATGSPRSLGPGIVTANEMAKTAYGETGKKHASPENLGAVNQVMLNRMGLAAKLGQYGGTPEGVLAGFDANGYDQKRVSGVAGSKGNDAFRSATFGSPELFAANTSLQKQLAGTGPKLPDAVKNATNYSINGLNPYWEKGVKTTSFGPHTFSNPDKGRSATEVSANTLAGDGYAAGVTQSPAVGVVSPAETVPFSVRINPASDAMDAYKAPITKDQSRLGADWITKDQSRIAPSGFATPFVKDQSRILPEITQTDNSLFASPVPTPSKGAPAWDGQLPPPIPVRSFGQYLYEMKNPHVSAEPKAAPMPRSSGEYMYGINRPMVSPELSDGGLYGLDPPPVQQQKTSGGIPGGFGVVPYGQALPYKQNYAARDAFRGDTPKEPGFFEKVGNQLKKAPQYKGGKMIYDGLTGKGWHLPSSVEAKDNTETAKSTGWFTGGGHGYDTGQGSGDAGSGGHYSAATFGGKDPSSLPADSPFWKTFQGKRLIAQGKGPKAVALPDQTIASNLAALYPGFSDPARWYAAQKAELEAQMRQYGVNM